MGLLAEVRLLKHKRIYTRQITYFGRRDSVVGIERLATGLTLCGSNPVGSEISRAVQTICETHLASCTMGTESLSPPTSSTEVKERVELYSHFSSVLVSVGHGVTFTSTNTFNYSHSVSVLLYRQNLSFTLSKNLIFSFYSLQLRAVSLFPPTLYDFNNVLPITSNTIYI